MFQASVRCDAWIILNNRDFEEGAISDIVYPVVFSVESSVVGYPVKELEPLIHTDKHG
jgi:hypothetical protein